MANRIFRKASLDRLSSPEQLDALMTITSPRGWLALTGAAVLVIAIVAWGFLGAVTTKVNGYGILIKSGGLQGIISTTAGQITDVRVRPGDLVHRGQIVARVAQPELVDQIDYLRGQLEELQAEPFDDARTITALERQLKARQRRLEADSWIVSSFDGRVVQVDARRGDLIGPGQSLARLELIGEQIKDLEAILYVDAGESKSIAPGMLANLSPASVRSQEHGLLLGRVTWVSDYPTTYEAMLSTLGSEILVQQLASGGAQVEVHVDLVPDSDTASGYSWTSRQGPPMPLDTGTLTSGAVVIESRPPVTMVLPVLR